MRIILPIILLLIILPIVNAQQIISDFNQYDYLTLNYQVYGAFEIKEKSNNARTLEVISNLSLIPRQEYNHKILEIKLDSEPQSRTILEETATYIWTSPTQTQFHFSLDAKVKIQNSISVINQKIEFPIETQKEEFLEPTEFIDITPEIRTKALEIAEGEDDLYVVVFNIGEWVRTNIKYDLGTLTAEVVQKSSWVLTNREGVCDEITNLFISMVRSLGIPARYVSGMAYTNLDNKWGPHAWAEVYFPEKGWVPFDVTYGQLGWIDPSHIKLKTSQDSGEASVNYQWKSIDTELNAREINITTELIERGELIESSIDIAITPLMDNVGPGSYVPISIEISNSNNYYMPVGIIIKKSPKLLENNFRPVLLKPYETKKFFWTAKIEDNTQTGYTYKTIIEAEDQFHKQATATINYATGLKVITKQEAEEIISENQVEDKKKYSPNIQLQCTSPDHIFAYEQLKIDCKIKNIGNTELENIQICIKTNCNNIDSLGISQEETLTYSVDIQDKGIQTIEIKTKSGNTEATDIVRTEVLESPDLKITSINYPPITDYKQEFDIEMTIAAKSPVKDIKIQIENKEAVNINNLVSSGKIIIKTQAKNYYKTKKIPIKIEFKDKNDKIYEIEKEYNVEITNAPWYARLLNWLGF